MFQLLPWYLDPSLNIYIKNREHKRFKERSLKNEDGEIGGKKKSSRDEKER